MTMTAKTKKAAALTLLQQALGSGFESLADLAEEAQVPASVVYQANLGQPPSDENIDRLVEALNRAPRPARVSANDVLDAIALGAIRKIDKLRRKGKG